MYRILLFLIFVIGSIWSQDIFEIIPSSPLGVWKNDSVSFELKFVDNSSAYPSIELKVTSGGLSQKLFTSIDSSTCCTLVVFRSNVDSDDHSIDITALNGGNELGKATVRVLPASDVVIVEPQDDGDTITFKCYLGEKAKDVLSTEDTIDLSVTNGWLSMNKILIGDTVLVRHISDGLQIYSTLSLTFNNKLLCNVNCISSIEDEEYIWKKEEFYLNSSNVPGMTSITNIFSHDNNLWISAIGSPYASFGRLIHIKENAIDTLEGLRWCSSFQVNGNQLWFVSDKSMHSYSLIESKLTTYDFGSLLVSNEQHPLELILRMDNKGKKYVRGEYYAKNRVLSYDDEYWRWIEKLDFDKIYCMEISPIDNSLWLGTDRGVVQYRNDSVTIHEELNAAFSNYSSLKFTFEQNGNMWFWSYQGGLWYRDGDSLLTFSTETSQLPNDSIYDLQIDDSKTVWLSTRRGIVKIYNGRIMRVPHPNEYSNVLFGKIRIVDDSTRFLISKSGELITMSKNGYAINILNKEGNQVQNKYNCFNSTANGFQIYLQKEMNVKSILHDARGRELASFDHGLLQFGTHNFTFGETNIAPGVYLLSIRMNGRSFTKQISFSN